MLSYFTRALPIAGGSKISHRILSTRYFKLCRHGTLVERSESYQQAFRTEKLFYQRNGLVSTPETQGFVVRACVETSRRCRLVVYAIFNFPISLKSGSQMTVCIDNQAGRVFQAPQHENSSAGSTKAIATNGLVRRHRDKNIGCVFELRGFSLDIPFPSKRWQTISLRRPATFLIIASKSIEVVINLHAILCECRACAGSTHQDTDDSQNRLRNYSHQETSKLNFLRDKHFWAEFVQSGSPLHRNWNL